MTTPERPTPSPEDILRRMLSTPPQPYAKPKAKPESKPAKKPKK